MAGQPNLQGMPPELKVSIMQNLDAASLSALITTSRSAHDFYTQHRGVINDKVSSKALGHARPLALALYAANRAPWKAQWPVVDEDRLLQNVHHYGTRYLNRSIDQPSIPTDQMTPRMILQMLAFHRIVEDMADDYMDWAVNMHTHKDVSAAGGFSSTEIARVQRGFYAIEIIRVLLPYEMRNEFDVDKAWNVLWHYFSPWENRIAQDIEFWIQSELNLSKSSSPRICSNIAHLNV